MFQSSASVLKGVDLFKFLMAIVVVAIHTTSWKMFGMRDVAVPYFFMASGYFLFRKMEKSGEGAMLPWMKSTLKLYLVWTVIYLPFTIYGFVKESLPVGTSVALFVRNLFLVGENYLSWPLWYLLAMLWAGAIIYVLRRLKAPLWLMFVIAAILSVMAKVLDLDNFPLYVKLFKSTRNGIFLGLLYMVSGGIVHQIQEKLPNKILLWLLFAVIAFGAMQYSRHFVFIFTLILFVLSLNINPDWFSTAASSLLRGMSKWVYLTHMIFAGVLIVLAISISESALFATTLILAMITAFLLEFRKTEKR